LEGPNRAYPKEPMQGLGMLYLQLFTTAAKALIVKKKKEKKKKQQQQ
jgi:hypothetical protein